MGKAKLIKSTGSSKNNPQGHWYIHDEIKPFIQGVEAGDLDENQVSGTLISGVPTAWARPKLFWFAFDYKNDDANIQTSGLFGFYSSLIQEWKGLMAVIALFPDRISFSTPIVLDADGNWNDIPSAFGRMLLDEKDLWIDLQKKAVNPEEKPFIQLIKYNGKVIGGTSPFSIFFPGIEYSGLKNTGDIPWYTGGKFTDPLNYIRNDKDKVQKLYLFVKNLNANFDAYERNQELTIDGRTTICHPDLTGLKSHLREWERTLKNLFNDLQNNGTVAKYLNLCAPYSTLMVSNQKVYLLKTGDLTFTMPVDSTLIVAELKDLQNVLNDSKRIVGWFESSDYKQPLEKAAVYYLKVNDVKDKDNPVKYFALPLSLEGLQMFGKNIGVLVSHNNPKFDISGRINEQDKLVVDLTVTIDNQPYKLNSREYEIEWAMAGRKVIVWPNFVSDKWDAYYLYSEFPSNLSGMKFIPFYKHCIDGNIISVERPDGIQTKSHVVYSNSPDDMKRDAHLDILELVKYPVGQVTDEQYKYEVTKSNCPIAGLEIRIENAGQSETAGYLMVKNPGDLSMGENKISDFTTTPINATAVVGIDFGSNNTCVHYTVNNNTFPIKFENRRLALVGTESVDGNIAERDELLFFSNEPTENGQVKSWLHEHDTRYIGANKDKEIAGGVAVNEKNIVVKEMTREIITTQAGILHYNMKWLSDISGIAKKTAYLKAIWLSVCADLYANQLAPLEIRWSFPSSMSPSDLGQYRNIYNAQLPNMTPIFNDDKQRLCPKPLNEQTESESVCKYAIGQKYGLNNAMFLGIDVGGSTSDILLLAKDINNNYAETLFSQSSVRIAAGVFFDAVIKSQRFRKAIYDFHESQRSIHVENISEILTAGNKAPFYLNSVFDQLTPDNSSEFYSWISREAPFVFAIPAYVTGLLVYYAGKLCAKTIREHNLTGIRTVHLMPFGKGGRLFHWLQTNPGIPMTASYYENCFKKAFGEDSENIRLNYRTDIVSDNKSEVSKGLVSNQNLVFDANIRYSSDIFAEKGIKYLNNGQFDILDENDVVRNDYFENVGQFEFPDKMENFETFLELFIDFVSQKAGLVTDVATLRNRKNELPSLLSSFITNDSEYDKARKVKQQTGQFEYRFPIFIAEGLCYLDKVIIPEVFKD